MAFVPQGERVRFVLVEPSHAGNIGASARAINTMGFSRLYVVNPRDKSYKEDPDAVALCTRSVDILNTSVMVPTLEEALKGVRIAYALSGYDREYGPPMMNLTSSCEEVKELLNKDDSSEVAFVFGTERSGLTNEQICLCQRCVGIPANPECDSLNLAQAVQVTAYQVQMTIRGTSLSNESHRFKEELPAPALAVDKLLEHLKQALVSCGALDEAKPKYMMERFRKLFLRADLSQSEVDMLRGVCAAVICSKEERKGSKKASKEI